MLFQAGIEEQEICKRTGHRSLAVRDYKVSSVAQQQCVSKLLDPPQKPGSPVLEGSQATTLSVNSTVLKQHNCDYAAELKSPGGNVYNNCIFNYYPQ